MIEVARERLGATPVLVRKAGREGRQRRQWQKISGRSGPVVEREPSPGDEGAGSIVAAEDRAGKRPALVGGVRPAPREVETDRPDLLGNPGVERRESQRVGRAPERLDVLTRSRQEELAELQPDLVAGTEAKAPFDEALEQARSCPTGGGVPPRRAVDEQTPARRRLPVESEPELAGRRLGACALRQLAVQELAEATVEERALALDGAAGEARPADGCRRIDGTHTRRDTGREEQLNDGEADPSSRQGQALLRRGDDPRPVAWAGRATAHPAVGCRRITRGFALPRAQDTADAGGSIGERCSA
jgi:hypothetical protein